MLGGLAVISLGAAPVANAHPLGNATVNHYDGLHLYPDRLTDQAVEDIAEIPTLQRKSLIDRNGDGKLDDAERAGYASGQCAAMASADDIAVDGRRLTLHVDSSSYTERPGVIRLTVGRLECQLSSNADLSGHRSVTLSSAWDSAGIGWHEITAVGTGLALQQSPFPATSVSDELRKYPNDMLSSPLNVRGGTLDVTAGSGTSTYAAAQHLPVAGVAVRALNKLATAFNDLVGSRHLTVGIGLLAILLSMLLGAGHAFLPGHGKTIMAAYLVGRRGRLRDVVLVGATVTITHTAGVLVLGLIISITAAFSTTAAEQDLGIISGLIIAGVGLGLLVSALVRLRRHRQSPVVQQLSELALVPAGVAPAAMSAHDHSGHDHSGHDHHHGDEHSHADTHEHSHADEHSHGHTHGPGLRHSHGPGFSRGGLVGLGVAGGLVPSPSALLVLLAAIALGRTAFGIVLVLGYGLGMAGALTAAGLLLVKLRDRLGRIAAGRKLSAANRLIFLMPFLTAALVLVVGVGLTLRAADGIV